MSIVSVTALLLITGRVALVLVHHTAQVAIIWLALRGARPALRAPILAALQYNLQTDQRPGVRASPERRCKVNQGEVEKLARWSRRC